jgi:hypothetical protein
LLVAVVLVVALPACGGEGDAPSAPVAADTPTAMPCGREADTGAAGPDGIVPLGAFVSVSNDFTDVWLWGSRVAYVSEERAVVVCDLRTGEARVVGRVDRAKEFVGGVRAHGDTVVWTEYENTMHPEGAAPWVMRVHDLRRGRTSSIATGSPRGRYFTTPEPEIEGSTVVWLDLPANGPADDGPDLVAYELRTGTRRTLSSGTYPYSPHITQGQVYFSAKTEESRDLFVVPADGSSPPRRLTHEGGVDELDARNGWVTWLRFPVHHDPRETIGDLPVVALRIGTTETRVVASGVHPPRAGNGVVFGSSVEVNGYFVVNADGTDLRTFPNTEHQADWSIDGNRVAWSTVDNPLGKRKPAYLRIGRVER